MGPGMGPGMMHMMQKGSGMMHQQGPGMGHRMTQQDGPSFSFGDPTQIEGLKTRDRHHGSAGASVEQVHQGDPERGDHDEDDA